MNNLKIFLLKVEETKIKAACSWTRALVIAAKDEEDAKSLATEVTRSSGDYIKNLWRSPECQMIGYAAKKIERGIILEDYLECCDGTCW